MGDCVESEQHASTVRDESPVACEQQRHNLHPSDAPKPRLGFGSNFPDWSDAAALPTRMPAGGTEQDASAAAEASPDDEADRGTARDYPRLSTTRASLQVEAAPNLPPSPPPPSPPLSPPPPASASEDRSYAAAVAPTEHTGPSSERDNDAATGLLQVGFLRWHFVHARRARQIFIRPLNGPERIKSVRLSQTVFELKDELQATWPLGDSLSLRCGTKMLRDTATLQSSGVRAQSVVCIHLKAALKGGASDAPPTNTSVAGTPAESDAPPTHASVAGTPAERSRKVQALECMFFSDLVPGGGTAIDRANKMPIWVVQPSFGAELNWQEDGQPRMYGQVVKISSCLWDYQQLGWNVRFSQPPPRGFVALALPPGERWNTQQKFSQNFTSDLADIAVKISTACPNKPALLIICMPRINGRPPDGRPPDGRPTDGRPAEATRIDVLGGQLSIDDTHREALDFPVLLMHEKSSLQVHTALLRGFRLEAFTREPSERRTYVNGSVETKVRQPKPAEQPQGNMLQRISGAAAGAVAAGWGHLVNNVSSSLSGPKLVSAELEKLLDGSPLGVPKAIEAISWLVDQEKIGILQLDMEKICGMLVSKATANDFGLYLLMAWHVGLTSSQSPTPSGGEEALLTSCFERLLSNYVSNGSWRDSMSLHTLQEERMLLFGQSMMNHFARGLAGLLESAHHRTSTIKGLVELQQLHAVCLQDLGSKNVDFRNSWVLLFRALTGAHMQQGLAALLVELSTVLPSRTSHDKQHEFSSEDHKNLVKSLCSWAQSMSDFTMLVTMCSSVQAPEVRIFASTEAKYALQRVITCDFNKALTSTTDCSAAAIELCQLLCLLPPRHHHETSVILELAVQGACDAAGSRFSSDGFEPLVALHAVEWPPEMSGVRGALVEALKKHAAKHFFKLKLPLRSAWLKSAAWDTLRSPPFIDICERLSLEQRLHFLVDGDFSQVLDLFSILLRRYSGTQSEVYLRLKLCRMVDLFLTVDISRKQKAILALVQSLGRAGTEFDSCADEFATSVRPALQNFLIPHTSSHRRSGDNDSRTFDFCHELCKVLNGLDLEVLPRLLVQATASFASVSIPGWGPAHDAQLLRSRVSRMINFAESVAARQFVLALVMRCVQSCPPDLRTCALLLAACKPIEVAYAHRVLDDPGRAFFCVAYELANEVSARFASSEQSLISKRVANVASSFEDFCTKTRENRITGMELGSICAQWPVLNALQQALFGKHGPLPPLGRLDESYADFINATEYLQQQSQFTNAMVNMGVDRSALVDHMDAIGSPVLYDVAAVLRAQAVMKAWVSPMQPQVAFFEYFCMVADDTKSILCEHMLGQKLAALQESLSPSVFARVLASVKDKLDKLLQGDEVDFLEVQAAGEKLVKIGRSSSEELQMIQRFFGTSTNADLQRSLNGLQAILQLGQLAMHLRSTLARSANEKESFIDTLERYSFACVQRNDSGDFEDMDLEHLNTATQQLEETTSRTMREFIDLRAAIHAKLLGYHEEISDEQHERCLGLFMLFERLSNADRVFNFVKSGMGSDLSEFKQKLELVQSQLGSDGSADEKLLQQLDNVVRYISPVAAHHGSSLAELMAALQGDAMLMQEVSRKGDSRFLEITQVQSHMARLEVWLVNGLDGLEAVFSQYKEVRATGYFELCLSSKTLRISYQDEQGNVKSELSANSLVDFEDRLGFVQLDEKALGLGVPQFLKDISEQRKALKLMCELRALGHPDYQWPNALQLKVDDIMFFSVASLRTKLADWKQRLHEVSRDFPHLRFYSSAETQVLHTLLKDVPTKSRALHELTLLLGPMHSSAQLTALSGVVHRAASANAGQVAGEAWPIVLGRFLTLVHEELGSPPLILRPPSADAVFWKGLHLHDLSHTVEAGRAEQQAEQKPSCEELVLRLLMSIYERLPEAFEVLWCDEQTTSLSIETFVERMRENARRCFAIVHVNALTPTAQQALLRLLLASRDAEHLEQNLHCIQTGPSILHAAAWIKHHKEPRLSRQTRDQEQAWLRERVVDGANLSSVAFLVGDSGSGKTHESRKRLAAWAAAGKKKCVVSITEGFSPGVVAAQLRAAVLEHGLEAQLAVCFHINLGRFRPSERPQWDALMAAINRFFFGLLVLRSVDDPAGSRFNVPPACQWDVLVEVPHRAGHLEEAEPLTTEEGMLRELPVLHHIGQKMEPPSAFDLGLLANDGVRLVCKYLKADQEQTIDQLYTQGGGGGPKDVMIVLDASSSMSGGWLETCKVCVRELCADHLVPGDNVGLLIFNDRILEFVTLQLWPENQQQIHQVLNRAGATGGTDMWSAVERAAAELVQRGRSQERFIVALTDGYSGHSPQGKRQSVLEQLRRDAHQSVSIITIAVNMQADDQQEIHATCVRSEKDCIISADGGMEELRVAWRDAGEKLTVSEKIELADVSDEMCLELLQQYMKLESRVPAWSKQKQAHWVSYMHRRVHILKASEKFNKNEQYQHFGSTTMRVMLEEADHALSDDYRRNWDANIAHEQFVYWQDEDGDVKWSIISTKPSAMSEERKALLASLEMHVPSQDELHDDPRVLHSYLAAGLGVELQNRQQQDPFEIELGTLRAVEENKFVLTLDFTMKMLCMFERIACRAPCIMEGETGVSKTALTRMLFILLNKQAAAADVPPNLSTAEGFASAVREAVRHEAHQGEKDDDVVSAVLGRLAMIYADRIETDDDTMLSGMRPALLGMLKADPSLDAPPDDVAAAVGGGTPRHLFAWFVNELMTQMHAEEQGEASRLSWTFQQVNVDAALTPKEIEERLLPTLDRARRLMDLGEMLDSPKHRETRLCIFLDEVNTSSYMGVFKELIVDRRLNGADLPSNVVVIAACNPARDKLSLSENIVRREELGKEWAMGHYQVHPLPKSIEQLVWDYGALTETQEAEFVEKRLALLYDGDSADFAYKEQRALAVLICKSQKLTRYYAEKHISERVAISRGVSLEALAATDSAEAAKIEADVKARASSVVSLRDIQRVFTLFKWFCELLELRVGRRRGEMGAASSASAELIFSEEDAPVKEQQRRAMLLTIGVVYYLRLSPQYRVLFHDELHADEDDADLQLDPVLDECMTTLLDHTDLEVGIARTQGLKENVFMTVICTFARIPLTVIGPPGSSKTLSVTIVADNAKGEQAKARSFYRTQKRLAPHHYQCSKRSTSKEIEAVFKRAIDKQVSAYGDTLCFVFMDEAGLPEEERESLKVLHYYLEDHMSRPAQVGFVAITNHVLDAAKSNRCAILLRAEPGHDELMQIAWGCLEAPDHSDARRKLETQQVPGLHLRVPQCLERLCVSYQNLMSDTVSAEHGLGWFNTFFGLRDFMQFVKLLSRLSKDSLLGLEHILHALERNMNGVDAARLQKLLLYWLEALGVEEVAAHALVGADSRPTLRNPFLLMRESLAEQALSDTPISRYKLLIDTTSDESILRRLMQQDRRDLDTVRGDGTRCGASVLKLSLLPEDSGLQQVNLVSSAKYAAEKGETVVLSQTETINESFYDLFNQHFQRIEHREPRVGLQLTPAAGGVRAKLHRGSVQTNAYFAHIAIGSHSKLCRVSQGFQAIVHMRDLELRDAPAPFLNRFEKYRLTHAHLLKAHLLERALPPGFVSLVLKVMAKTHSLLDFMAVRCFYGACKDQTVESIVLDVVVETFGSLADVTRCAAFRALQQLSEQDPIVLAVQVELDGDDEALAVVSRAWQEPGQLARALEAALMIPADKVVVIDTGESAGESAHARAGEVMLGQLMLQRTVRQLLKLATPEQLYMKRAALPNDMLETFFTAQEHFSLKRMLRGMVEDGGTHKQIVFTRTSADVLAMPVLGLHEHDESSFAIDFPLLEALLCDQLSSGSMLPLADVALCPLSLISTNEMLVGTLRDFRQHEHKRAFVLFVDMAATPSSRVNLARMRIDEVLREAPREGTAPPPKSVVLVLHFPASNVYGKPYYDSTFCGGWDVAFLDSLSEEGSALGALDLREWLMLGASFIDSEAWEKKGGLTPALVGWLPQAMTAVVSRVEFPHGRSDDGFNKVSPVTLQGRVKLLDKLFRFDLGGDSMQDVLCRLYSSQWAADDHALIKDRVQIATQQLAAGIEHKSLVEAVTGEVRDVFTNFLTSVLLTMNENLNLDVLDDEALPVEVRRFFTQCIRNLDIPPVAELKLKTNVWKTNLVSYAPPPPSQMFPFFARVARIFDQALNDVASARPPVLEEESTTGTSAAPPPPEPAQLLPTYTEALELAASSSATKSQDELIAEVASRVSTSDATLASCAMMLQTDLSKELWDRYLAHFVARLYPREAKAAEGDPLEHQMLRAWLGAHAMGSRREQRVAALHVAARKHDSLLSGLASSLKPLARLVPGRPSAAFTRRFAACTETVQLLGAMVSEFHERMVAVFDDAAPSSGAVARWAHAFAIAELRQLAAAELSAESNGQLAVMSTVHAAACRVTEASTAAELVTLRGFVQSVRDAVTDGLRLKPVWDSCQEHYAEDSALKQRLLVLWCNAAGFGQGPMSVEVREDVDFLLGTLVHESLLSEAQRVSALESLLASPAQTGPVLDLDILRRGAAGDAQQTGSAADVLEIMERHLASHVAAPLENFTDAYAPSWFEQGVAPLDDELAHPYFKLVVRQLLVRKIGASGATDRSPLEQALAHFQRLEDGLRTMTAAEQSGAVEMRRARQRAAAEARSSSTRSGPPRAPHLRAVSLSAVQYLIIQRLAKRLAEKANSAAPMESLLTRSEAQMGLKARLAEAVNAHEQWAWELVHCFCREMGSTRDARAFLVREKVRLTAELGDWITPWTKQPPPASDWRHTRLSFAVDEKHHLHQVYLELSELTRRSDGGGLAQLVRTYLQDGPAERARQRVLDLRMVVFAAVCDVRNDRPEPADGGAALLRALQGSSLQADLQLDEASMRLLCCFVQPSQFIGSDVDFLASTFRNRPTDRVTREMQACLAGMVAVTLGTEPERLHLYTHLTEPGALANTFGVGNQYAQPIRGVHYDCGCELTADGDYGRPGVARPPLTRHSLYFALFTSFGALAVSVLTQPGADGQLHGRVITAPGQTLRGYLHGVVAATWNHMATKLNLADSEQLCLLVLRSLEALRERTFEQPQSFRRLFRTINEVEAYEAHLHECFGAERARLQTHVGVLNQLADVDRQWAALSAYSAAHPPMQIAVHYSNDLIKEHVAFAEALEARLAVPDPHARDATALLHMFTQRCHQLRFLWVLPDLIQLYKWLHWQLDNLFFEQKAHDMCIGELLKLLHRRAAGERWEGDMAVHQRFSKAEARKLKLLWLRAKTGYNQFVAAMDGRIGHGACAGQAEAAGRDDRLNKLDPIDESQPLWRFLTTHADVDKAAEAQCLSSSGEPLAGDCLFVVISRMTEKHNEFLRELEGYGLEVSATETLKPLELDHVALGDVRPWEDLRLHLQHEEADLEKAAVKMSTQLQTSLLRLDQMGAFAKIVQRHWSDGTASFDLAAIGHEVRETFLRRLMPIADPANQQHLRCVFRFRQVSAAAGESALVVERLELELARAFESGGGGGPSATSEATHSLFLNMFHSLDHGVLQGLLRALDIVIPHAVQTQSGAKMRDATVAELLEAMFPEVPPDERLERVCSKTLVGDESDAASSAERRGHHDERLLREEEQRGCLLGARGSELPSLLNFIRAQLDAPDFSQVPIELKEKWNPAIELAMLEVHASFGEGLAAAAHDLEDSLGGYEEQLAQLARAAAARGGGAGDANAGLHAFLTVALGAKDETELFEALPLMQQLPQGLAAKHYVELRKKLRRWAAQTAAHAPPTEGWFWPFVNKPAAPSIDVAAAGGEVWGRAMWFETPADLIDIRAASEARQAAAERKQAEELKAKVHMMGHRIFLHLRKYVQRRHDKMSRRLQHHTRQLLHTRRERAAAAERAARQEAAQQALVALGEAADKATLYAALAEALSLQEHLPALAEATPKYQQTLQDWEEQERAVKRAKRRHWLFAAGALTALALAVVVPSWQRDPALNVGSGPGVGTGARIGVEPLSRAASIQPEQLARTTQSTPLAAAQMSSPPPPAPAPPEPPEPLEPPEPPPEPPEPPLPPLPPPPPPEPLPERPEASPRLEAEHASEPHEKRSLGPPLPPPPLEEQMPPEQVGEPPVATSLPTSPPGPAAVNLASNVAEAYAVAKEKLFYVRKLRDAGEITEQTYLEKEKQIISEL